LRLRLWLWRLWLRLLPVMGSLPVLLAQRFGITVTEEILVSAGSIKLCLVATLPI
jgi:hypothetical protein